MHSIPPPHPPTPLARSGCLSVPFRLLAGPLVAYLFSCLLYYFFLRLLACNSGCLLSFVRLLARPLRLLAFLLGCLPGLKAAFPLHGLLALPRASRSPLARCLCLLVRLSCVVSRLVCFVVYLLSIAAAPARRVCSPASPEELFLGRHLMLSEDFAFFLWRSSAPPCQVGRYVRIIILLYPGKVHRFGQIMSVVCSFPPLRV